MTTVNGWLIAWGLAMSLVALVASLIAALEWRAKQDVKAQRDRLNFENESLHHDCIDLHAQLADRNEALQEAQAEIKALQMNTIPLQEAVKPDVPLSYAEAKPAIDQAAQSTKRPPRGRRAGQP